MKVSNKNYRRRISWTKIIFQ